MIYMEEVGSISLRVCEMIQDICSEKNISITEEELDKIFDVVFNTLENG